MSSLLLSATPTLKKKNTKYEAYNYLRWGCFAQLRNFRPLYAGVKWRNAYRMWRQNGKYESLDILLLMYSYRKGPLGIIIEVNMKKLAYRLYSILMRIKISTMIASYYLSFQLIIRKYQFAIFPILEILQVALTTSVQWYEE